MKKLPNDSTSVSFESADGDQRRGPGRPTVNNEILRGDRDALVWALSIKWGDCGWQIQNAATVAELRRALEPLRGHCPEHLITPFLRVTSLPATASEVRSLKKAQGEAVRRDREARDKHDRRAELARKAELAMNQTEPARPPTLQGELLKSWGESKKARNELERAQADLKTIEEDLADKSASFSQNELLHYITLKKYARDPLGLANAMAGLPDMSWEQSHARCSKLDYEQWPTFEFRLFVELRAIWNRRDSFPQRSLVALFRQEIEKLPQKVIVDYPHSRKKVKQNNILRFHLADRAMYLRLAIEEIEPTSTDPERVPFLILSAFRKQLAKPQTAQDSVLAERERIK